eukprot:COSAG02_NODE_12758_length_1498_cov_5.039314_2_plen_62_part_00
MHVNRMHVPRYCAYEESRAAGDSSNSEFRSYAQFLSAHVAACHDLLAGGGLTMQLPTVPAG